jgi:hypothetical protein
MTTRSRSHSGLRVTTHLTGRTMWHTALMIYAAGVLTTPTAAVVYYLYS